MPHRGSGAPAGRDADHRGAPPPRAPRPPPPSAPLRALRAAVWQLFVNLRLLGAVAGVPPAASLLTAPPRSGRVAADAQPRMATLWAVQWANMAVKWGGIDDGDDGIITDGAGGGAGSGSGSGGSVGGHPVARADAQPQAP